MSQLHRRIRPFPTQPHTAPFRACAHSLATPTGCIVGHTHWPACSALPRGGALELHLSPLPTEYEQQPAPVPSMEKKRTVYQMALSKMPQLGPSLPGLPFCHVPLSPG